MFIVFTGGTVHYITALHELFHFNPGGEVLSPPTVILIKLKFGEKAEVACHASQACPLGRSSPAFSMHFQTACHNLLVAQQYMILIRLSKVPLS